MQTIEVAKQLPVVTVLIKQIIVAVHQPLTAKHVIKHAITSKNNKPDIIGHKINLRILTTHPFIIF